MKTDFVLCYEYWQRELYALMQVRCELEKKGYRVKILNIQPNINDFLEYYYYEPKVVVFPWVYGDKELERARAFRGNVQKIVNMQCEQLLSKRVLKSGFFKIRDNAINAYHVSWGVRTHDRYKEYGVDENKIWNIGNINLEINKKEFDGIFYKREKLAERYKLDVEKKWFLFCSNFKFTNMKLHELGDLELRTTNIFRLKYEMSKAKKSILQWIERFLQENEDYEIIYRPHPIEQRDLQLERMAEKYSNFKYIADMTINQWVRVCQRCATWNSTAILDSIYLDIPSAMIMPYELPQILKGDLDYLCNKIVNYEEFESFLKNDREIGKKQFEEYVLVEQEMAIQKFTRKLIELYEMKDVLVFQDSTLSTKEWRKKSIREKSQLFFFWISKYVKPIGDITKNNSYRFAYETKKREKKLYKKIKLKL